MSRRVLVAAVSLLLAVSCVGPRTTTGEMANALCPMGQEPVVESGGTVAWRGMTIGFCCKRCEPMFEELSEDEQVEALVAVGVTVHE